MFVHFIDTNRSQEPNDHINNMCNHMVPTKGLSIHIKPTSKHMEVKAKATQRIVIQT